ncbi:gliding motility-associated C-terminal domain-containing protein [Capnocytophaga granulosa]|uniref:gliding motility-associated C-terminal domain-containing protein n=1 Tax=Capnocytophaga granulosa TaxID=45242 RepID=UPI0028D7A146|nr:gliding motility-associated C-terminal domain-containing protein [Capnocytophaga granulosa]
MKKLNNYKRIWLILMMLSPFFSLVKAQTCDPNILKALSETRVTYFDKVTKGEKATITIKYPLIGTTYTVTDNDGNSKSFTYTSGTQEFVDLEIDSPVNAVRRYSLKAEKDGCSFQTGFNYTITPETDVKLAIRVEQEWCGTSGAIRFKVVGTGVDNTNYNFYLRKHNESYDYSTAKPHTGAISLAAGKYYVIAKRKSGSWPEPAESSEIEIKNDVKTIAFTASQIPKICGATSLGIRVDINQDQWGNHAANYPVYYTLYQSDGVTPVRPDTVHQTSNIFTGLTAGNYVVKVENFCGANPIPQPITLTDESFTFTHLYTPIAGKEFNCTKAQFDALYLYGTGIKKAVDSDAFNYPLTVKFTFTDPDGAVYTPTYVINNKTDLDTYLPKYYYGEALVVTSNFQEFNLPNKSGTWKIKADITMCGNTTSLAEVTSVLYNPIENAMVEVANDGTSPTACHTTQLRLRYKHRRDNSATLNTYLVIEQGPTRPSTDLFNYAGAGFSLMPATHSNPLLRGKYAKRILFSSWDFQTVVIPDYLRNGDTFNFRLVDDECDPTRYADLDPVTVTVPPTAVGVDIQVIASCEGATDIGAPNGSIRVERKNGAAVKKIEIIEYTDTANVVHTSGTIGGTSLSLPYTLTDNNRADENNWYVRDLPKGKYKFRITDVCNNITIPNHVPQIAGQTYNLNFAPGCEPVVVGRIDLGGTEDWRYNQSEFVIQHYKEDDQEWEEWAYAGLGYNENINRKTTDEGLGKVGKFRIVRRIKNLNGGYECQMVIKERTFEGDLNGIQVVGFGCNDKKYHVMLTPEGGTAPFTYKLIHKLPAGSTTPDTSVAKTQPGDQFFINLDGSNVNNAYKFAITDACGKTVEKELTIANIQKPKIEPKPKRDYYCTGQEVKLTITDLGPNVQVEWYREDNPSTPLATGFSYTIPSLTATDFAKKYYVKIKIPSQHAIESCVTDEVDKFKFEELSVTVPPLARTNNGETLKCITGPTVFDVESLFNIPNSHLAANLPTGATVRIREASGVIAVPNNHKINLRPRNGGQKPLGMGSYTFYYEVLSPCEKVITYQEAKLTVKELVDFVPKTTIKVCNPNVTLDEIKQEIIKGSPKVTALQPDFTWYATESNANARTSPLAGSTSLSTPNGSSQDYWLRLTKNGYCTPEPPIKVTIKGETGVTAKNLGDVGCQLTTIASLKSLIDPSDAANVLIYRRGTTVPLADDALVDNNEQYDYAKNIYQCVTAPQQVNFTFTPRTTAKNEQVDVCFYIGYYGMRTTLTQIKTKLQERYPTGATFKFYSAPEAIPANEYTSLNREFIQSELFYFTVQEAGKCVSLPFSVRPGQNAMTQVETKTVTICEEITVGELIAKMQTDFGYSNVKIHQGRGTGNMSDDTFVDWNNSIYFSAEETGKCRSTKVPLIIKRNTNVTVATPKTFEVCKAVGQQPKVSDLKAVVGNDARIFVRDNNNRWVLQADTQNVYEANSYFYTIEEAGKCPSEKTALVVRITRKTTTPSAPTAGTFCTGATIAALKDYIDNTPQNVGTIRVYATNTDTTPITDATALTHNTTYYFSLQDTDPTKCESDRRALQVTLVAEPTVNATYTYCAGTKLETLWNEIDASDSDDSLKFYETATSTTALARNADLRAGNYYVAESSTTSALGNCETTRVQLKVVLTKVTAITADLSTTEVKYCKGATNAAALSVTAEGTGNFTYTWYKATNTTETGTVVRTQANVTANQDTYTPATDAVGTAYYYVVVKSSCGDDKASQRAKITIQSLPAITTQPATLSKPCKDSTLTLSIAHTGDGNRSVQWYRNTTNSNTGGTAISGETANTFTVPTDTVGTTYYYAVVSSDTGCTPAVSSVAEVIVQSLPAITTQPAALSKPCKDSTLTLSIAHTGDGNRSVQWYRNTTNSNTGGTAISGETANTFTVPTDTVGTTYYYAVVSSDTGCTPAVSNVAEVVVTKPTAIDTNLSTTEKKYCKDQTSGVLDLLIKTRGTAPFTYKWYKAANATDAGTLVRTEANTNSDEDSYTPVVTTVETAYYYVEVSSACGSDVTSARAHITVTENTAIDTDLSTAEVKYCKGATADALLVKAKGTPPFTYQWHKVDAATSTHVIVRTELSTTVAQDTYTPETTTVGTSYYFVEVHSDCGADEISQRAKVTIEDITTKPTPTAVNLCQGATVADLKAQLALTLTGTLKVYATATDPADLADATLLNATTYYYTATETNKCESDRQAMAVTLAQAPTAQATYTYCVGTTVDTLWKAIDANDSDNSIRIYNVATGGTPLTRTDLLATTTYYVAETASNGGVVTCETSRVATQVTIGSVANPVIATTPATCGVATVVKITNHVPGINYTITDSANATVAGALVAADGTIGGITSAGTYKIKATQGTCVSGEETFTIAEALPVPETPTVMVAPPTCTAMSAAKVSNYTDYPHGETFTVTDSNGTVIGAVDNAGNITGLTTAGTYTLTITRGTCRAAAVDFDIADKLPTPAKPEITLTPASCTRPTVAKLTQVSGLTFWHNGTQLTVNPITHEITGLAPGTYTITAKNNNNCESVASDSFEIKAQQTATTITTAPAGATYQKGDEATPLAVVATGEGTLSYKWYKNTDNNNTSGTEVGDNSPSYKPATDRVGTFYYWVEVTSDCGAKKSTVAEIKVVEGAPTIEANDDPDTTVRRGQEVAVLGNDKVNGNPATPADVDITISNDGGLTRVGVNPATGKIMIPNDAAPATYEITYKICVKNQPTICDEAKVKITVEVPTLALKAVDDDFGKIPNAVDYTTTNTVFSTGVDTMEGVVGNLSPERDVVLTPGAQPHENITMNPNGSITVKRGTPKGTYTYEYTICQKDVPTNCDKAKVSFEVIEAHIFAKDDGVWEVGTEGALTPSILNNDILGERVGIAPSEVTITETNGKPVMDKTKMVMNEDGRISVKKNIPEGTYTYYYTITEKANISNTASAAVIIRVVSFSAQDDEFDITNDKTKEYKTESVLKNDELNKKKNPSPVDDVILTIGEAKDAERKPTDALTMNDDGTITIAPNTPDGVYTYTYRICKKSAQTECKSAEAVIKLLPALIANDDDFTANPINPLVKEGIAGNVLDNDRYADGNALEHLDKVEITMLEGQESRANIEPNGNVVIPQGAPAGEYTLTYSLCMKDHPTICAEAKVKIVILEDKPIVIHNGISANGDGVNDGFIIEHIEGYPKNNLKIFNRWGVLVYEKDGYTNSEPFDGHSNGRATISADSKLPQGTYYYILEYQDTAEQTHTKKGWLYLKY